MTELLVVLLRALVFSEMRAPADAAGEKSTALERSKSQRERRVAAARSDSMHRPSVRALTPANDFRPL
jgi:hypothetical protein